MSVWRQHFHDHFCYLKRFKTWKPEAWCRWQSQWRLTELPPDSGCFPIIDFLPETFYLLPFTRLLHVKCETERTPRVYSKAAQFHAWRTTVAPRLMKTTALTRFWPFFLPLTVNSSGLAAVPAVIQLKVSKKQTKKKNQNSLVQICGLVSDHFITKLRWSFLNQCKRSPHQARGESSWAQAARRWGDDCVQSPSK